MKKHKTKLNKRNRSYVNKQLDEFNNFIQLGFSHENFSEISKIVGKMSRHLNLEQQKALEQIWRDTYVDTYDPVLLEIVVNNIREQI